MTTIAARNGILAADRAMWADGMIFEAKKLDMGMTQSGPIAIAWCGNKAFSRLMAAHIFLGAEKPDWKGYYENPGENIGVVMSMDGSLEYLTCAGAVVKVLSPIYALAAGAEYALGAMHAGATAVEAVTLAVRYTDYAGIGVDWVSVDQLIEMAEKQTAAKAMELNQPIHEPKAANGKRKVR